MPKITSNSEQDNQAQSSSDYMHQTQSSQFQKNIFTRITGISVGLMGYILTIPIVAMGALAYLARTSVFRAKKIFQVNLHDKNTQNPQIQESAQKTVESILKPSMFFMQILNQSLSAKPLQKKFTLIDNKPLNKDQNIQKEDPALFSTLQQPLLALGAAKVVHPLVYYAGEKLQRIISPYILSYQTDKLIDKVTQERVAKEKLFNEEAKIELLLHWKVEILACSYLTYLSPLYYFLSPTEKNNFDKIQNFALSTSKNVLNKQNIIKEIFVILNRSEIELNDFLEIILNEIERGFNNQSMSHAKYMHAWGLNLNPNIAAEVASKMILELNLLSQIETDFSEFHSFILENLVNAIGTMEKKHTQPFLLLKKNELIIKKMANILFLLLSENDFIEEGNTNEESEKIKNNLKKLLSAVYEFLNGTQTKIPYFRKVHLKTDLLEFLPELVIKQFKMQNFSNSIALKKFLLNCFQAMLGIYPHRLAYTIARHVKINKVSLNLSQRKYLRKNLEWFFKNENDKNEYYFYPYKNKVLDFPSNLKSALDQNEFLDLITTNILQLIPKIYYSNNQRQFTKFLRVILENLYGVYHDDFQVQCGLEWLKHSNQIEIHNDQEKILKKYLLSMLKSMNSTQNGLRPPIPKFYNSIIEHMPVFIKIEFLQQEKESFLSALLNCMNIPNTTINRRFFKECFKEMQGIGYRKKACRVFNLFFQQCHIDQTKISLSDCAHLLTIFEELLDPMRTDRPIYFFQIKSIAQSNAYLLLRTTYEKDLYLLQTAENFCKRLVKDTILSAQDKNFAIPHIKKILDQIFNFSEQEYAFSFKEKKDKMYGIVQKVVQKLVITPINFSDEEKQAVWDYIELHISKIIDFQLKKSKFLVSGFNYRPFLLDETIVLTPNNNWIKRLTLKVSNLFFSQKNEKNSIDLIESAAAEIHKLFYCEGIYIGSSETEVKKITQHLHKMLYEIFGFDRRFKLSESTFKQEVITSWLDRIYALDEDNITQNHLKAFFEVIVHELQTSSLTGRCICPKWHYPPLKNFLGLSRFTYKQAQSHGLDRKKMLEDLSQDMLDCIGKNFPESKICKNMILEAVSQIFALPLSSYKNLYSIQKSSLSLDLEKYLTSQIYKFSLSIFEKMNLSSKFLQNPNQQSFIADFIENYGFNIFIKALTQPTVRDKTFLNELDKKFSPNYELRFKKCENIVDQFLEHFFPAGPLDIPLPEMTLTQEALTEFMSAIGISRLKEVSASLERNLSTIFQDSLNIQNHNYQSLLTHKIDIITNNHFFSEKIAVKSIHQYISKKSQEVQTSLLYLIEKRTKPKLDQIKQLKNIDLHQGFCAVIDTLDACTSSSITKSFQVFVYHVIRSNLINKLYENSNNFDNPMIKIKMLYEIISKINKKIEANKQSMKPYNAKKTSTIFNFYNPAGTKTYAKLGEELFSNLLPQFSQVYFVKKFSKFASPVIGKVVQKKVNEIIYRKILDDVFNLGVVEGLNKVSEKAKILQAAKSFGEPIGKNYHDKSLDFISLQQKYLNEKTKLKDKILKKSKVISGSIDGLINEFFNNLEEMIGRALNGDVLLDIVGEIAVFIDKEIDLV